MDLVRSDAESTTERTSPARSAIMIPNDMDVAP